VLTPCGIAAAAPNRRHLACYLQLAIAAATGTAAIITTLAVGGVYITAIADGDHPHRHRDQGRCLHHRHCG
jgi:hypothetical protein